MKALIRNFLINLTALWSTTKIIPGLTYSGGITVLFMGAAVFMIINWLIVPLLKLMFLPLNLLTLGIFGWAVNVVALYFLTALVPQFRITPFSFPGISFSGIIVPSMDLNVLATAILASFMIGLLSHFMQWLIK